MLWERREGRAGIREGFVSAGQRIESERREQKRAGVTHTHNLALAHKRENEVRVGEAEDRETREGCQAVRAGDDDVVVQDDDRVWRDRLGCGGREERVVRELPVEVCALPDRDRDDWEP
eukprot:2460937-Rhodomonas_salina.1